MKKIKVLHVTNCYPTTRHPEFCVFTKEQINSLDKSKIDNDIFFINAFEKGQKEYLKAFFKLRKMIKKESYDIIHCFHGLTFLLVMLLKPKSNILVSFQNPIEFEFSEKGKVIPYILVKITWWLIKRNKIGKIFKGKIPQILQNDKLSFYLPNGVDLDLFKPISKEVAKEKLNLDKRKTYLLFVSAKNLYRKQKRYDRFQKILKYLQKTYPAYNFDELTIVNISRELVPYYYNAASVLVVTSDFEGSPNSVKESFACNLPVVSTNVGNVKRIVENSKNSFICDSFTVEKMSEYIIQALNIKFNNRELLLQLGLDIKTVSEKIINIYKLLVNNK